MIDSTAELNMENEKSLASYSGNAKIEFCERLGDDWKQLADLLEINPSERAKWARGEAARAIWEWLKLRKQLGELPGNLSMINRSDLADTLNSNLNSATSSKPW